MVNYFLGFFLSNFKIYFLSVSIEIIIVSEFKEYLNVSTFTILSFIIVQFLCIPDLRGGI